MPCFRLESHICNLLVLIFESLGMKTVHLVLESSVRRQMLSRLSFASASTSRRHGKPMALAELNGPLQEYTTPSSFLRNNSVR